LNEHSHRLPAAGCHVPETTVVCEFIRSLGLEKTLLLLLPPPTFIKTKDNRTFSKSTKKVNSTFETNTHK
jgi:hypothetical protein